MAVLTASAADHEHRLRLFMCCLAQKGVDLSNKLRISTSCSCDISTFELLHMYWSVLVCYKPAQCYLLDDDGLPIFDDNEEGILLDSCD